jgi:Zn-dependent protease with chaperone function
MAGSKIARSLLLLAMLMLEAACQSVPELSGITSTIFDRPATPPATAPATTSAAPPAKSPAGSPSRTAAPTATTVSAVIEPSAEALNELRVDRQCRQVTERFDVWEKAATYAGTNAQLRLRVLLTSDFAHSDLNQSDQRFLRYLAYTTVWIPASVESRIGRAYAALADGGDKTKMEHSGRSQRKAAARLSERLSEMRDTIEGFPGTANLVLDPDLHDGAFARVGGIVVVSPRFLSMMDERDEVRDVVFAHELSHLYKRHTIKELQYRLISSAAGWEIAKKLLGKAIPSENASVGSSMVGVVNSVTDLVSYGQMATQLFELVRKSQLTYSKDQELEADTCALQWLAALRVEPRAAWQTFADVLADTTPGDDTVSYVVLHPSPAERVANIEQALGHKPPLKGPSEGKSTRKP